jgi:acyl-CoA synthetase (AMP-forming)/AMP-acid ligase II
LLDDALRVIEPPAMGSGVEASKAREAAGSIACTGQIAIGGPQLAQGYLNQSALTAERFVEHPTLGYRVYLTGDVAAWACTPDGAPSLRLLGRRDQQVKLNGMRLELGEVNTEARALPSLKNLPPGVKIAELGDAQEMQALFASFGIASDQAGLPGGGGIFRVETALVLAEQRLE